MPGAVAGIGAVLRGGMRPILCAAMLFGACLPGAHAAPPVPREAPDRVQLGMAFGAIDSYAFDRARRIARHLDAPLARKAIRWRVLLAQQGGGVFDTYRAFLRDNPDWPGRDTLRYRAEGVMPASLPDDEVLRFFRDIEPYSPYGAERYADALRSVGRTAEAKAVLRRAWSHETFPKGDAERFHDRYHKLFSQELERERLDRLIWTRHLDAAENQLWRVGEPHRRLAIARIRLARMAYGVDKAIDKVPEELRDHPGLVFERARWRRMKGRYADTMELLLPPRANVPHPRRWWEVRHWAVREAMEKGHYSDAYRVAANHGMSEGIGFAQAEWLAGFVALRFLRMPEQALDHFRTLHEGVSTPVSRARAAYWAGRAAAALANRRTARRWYETAATNLTTYYGQLAAAKLDNNLFLALPEGPEPGEKARDSFAKRELVRVVRTLARMGHAGRVDRFVQHLSAQAGNSVTYQLIADLARSIDRRDLAVSVARDARREGIILPDHLYPIPRLPALRSPRTAGHRATILALVRQESNFDSHAVSPAGAYGMMQLMPATARTLADELDMPFSRQRLRRNPNYNMRLGRHYLNELIARYDGAVMLAIAAYNAGPSAVDRWLHRYGDPRTGFISPVTWIEQIPYGETRNYVQRVMESMMVYRHRRAPTRVALDLDHATLLGDAQAGPQQQAGTSCCL
ncbi:soluble lytic murein transglycosylase [Limimonas halophila]|uniref:Soluble lytic murein transglycosylase n=1 Tax=Limimonas halophila TaxID=1082479 RepID=A0A1G7P2I6_9PROT|nr:lytic transglycosylase domain-containing protein [Limimonas halophila]SDF80473.1 soluble lytic murein transglycosylase [Limimonas halophila]